MLAMISHIEVLSFDGSMPNWEAQLKIAQAHKDVIGAAPYVAGQGMLARGDQFRGVLLRGVEPALEGAVSDLPKFVKQTRLTDLTAGSFNVILGLELARSLGVQIGDAVNLILPAGSVSPAGFMPRMRKLNVIGVFDSGHFEYDSGVVVLHRQDAAKLMQIEEASGVRIKLNDMEAAPRVANELTSAFGRDILVRDWGRSNRTWFAAVQVEKRMMFIILALIIAVAAFNLVSMLVMTVTEKHGQIAILRTLGATPASIRRIFIVQGFVVGVLGVLAGTTFGVLIAANLDVIVPAIEALTQTQFLPKDIYFISAMPSDLRLDDVLTVTGMALALSLLATLYPSAQAAKIQPAEALRYE